MCTGMWYSCLINTRLQFDPNDGVLNLNFKTLTFSVSYDKDQVVVGEQNYEWGTNGYCWIRDPNNRRRGLSEFEKMMERDLQTGENTYEIRDLPTPTSSSSAMRLLNVLLGVALVVFIFFLA